MKNPLKKLNFFKDLNLSDSTLEALNKLGYISITKIQRIAIPPALKGRDILGSARTGSGKTLCFVIPIIENLKAKEWTDLDSIGACIICPIRELGIQIFNIIKWFSSFHTLTGEILIGGKSREEKKEIKPYSILVATPGSLIKESSTKKFFSLDNLKILCFDEVDKIFDMGFHQIFSFILKIIPLQKQTFLFSATLTKKIKNLTRLNLKNPIFCSCREKNKVFKKDGFPETTKRVCQYYVKIQQKEKFSILFSFLRSHREEKILVFFSTRKQIIFFIEILKKLTPHLSLFYAYGNMKQKKRVRNIISFNESRKGIMLSTDLTSRGLDFKGLDWVIQADCPHDVETYLHRIGRTGRFGEKGKSLLIISIQEKFFLKLLTADLIRIFRIKILKEQVISIEGKISQFIKRDPKFDLLCRSAFLNYIRFIFFQKNKKIFKLSEVEIQERAQSFGLEAFDLKKESLLKYQ